MKLTDEQTALLESKAKIVVGVAAMGCGKSLCLVDKAIHYQGGSKILITTFTKKCKNELVSRLGESSKYDIVTIHGLCLRLIKANWKMLGSVLGSKHWPEEPSLLFTEDAEAELVQEIRPFDYEKHMKLVSYFRKLKIGNSNLLTAFDNGLYFRGYKREDLMAYLEYESLRKMNGILIPNDFISLAAKILKFPWVNHDFYDQYGLVLVDEAQDLDSDHWGLLEPFVVGKQQLMFIGDAKQVCFSFAGGNGVVFNYLMHHPEAEVYPLSYNFRSRKKIVDLVNLIHPSRHMTAISVLDGKVNVYKAESLSDEAEFIRNLGNPVVLARTHKYLDSLRPYLPGHEFHTIHQSKGKEWDHVVLAGAQEGIIPYPISRNLVEENNLFGVACSRARKTTSITFVGHPSPLIPKDYLVNE